MATNRHHLQHRALSAALPVTDAPRGDQDKILTPIHPSGDRSGASSIGSSNRSNTFLGSSMGVHPFSAPIIASGSGTSGRSNQGRSASIDNTNIAAAHLMSMEPVGSRNKLPELGTLPTQVSTSSDARTLAIENQRLASRLQEAELSIKHYRSQLRPSSELRSVSVATQTTMLAPQRSYLEEESEKKIDQLTKMNARLQRQIDELSARSLDAPQVSSASDAETNALREQLEAAVRSERSTDKKYNRLRVKVTGSNKLLQSKIKVAQARVQALRSDMANIMDASKHLQNLITSASSDAALAIQQSISQFLQTRIENEGALTNDASNSVDVCTSPIPCGPASPKKRREQSLYDGDTTGDIGHGTRSSADARDQINKTIKELMAAHASQLNATKHSAHVKDLSRLATIRQVTLERDRALSELNHQKQVCDVLLFSVNALEKNISESQPEVASKLSTSRKRKIDALKTTLASQNRDLDQRSSEIGALSTVHLKGFEEKAQTKLKQCEDDSSRLIQQLTTEINDCFS